MGVPLNDVGRRIEALRPQLDQALSSVLDSGWYVMGRNHDALENELAAYLETQHVLLVANGTDALQLALTALEVGPGDLVLTAANAGGYTSIAAAAIGATPVYADIDPATMLVTVETLEAARLRFPRNPSVVVVTHLFGASADIAAIVAWAHAHGIRVVEDCAQSIGAIREGRRVGSFADAATLSFYPTKNLGAIGDAGAVATNDPAVAEAVRQLRQYGWTSKYRTDRPRGRNSRCDELQAAVLRVMLPHVDEWNDRRRSIHARYEQAIQGARLVNASSPAFVGHLAVVESEDRDAARETMAGLGIGTDIHYPVPDHLQPIAQDRPSLVHTERAASTIFTIPLFPELRDDEVDEVCRALERL
ncbi:DegT/DnrJ/EryC1/StrS family aminotransferase [Leifsonia shinshuensis]